MQLPSALILSDDTVAAALVGGAAELAGLPAEFPATNESVRDAIRRVHPAVVIADCSRATSHDEAFIGPAMMTGAAVAIFCASADSAEVARARAVASRYALAFFAFPGDVGTMHTFLDHVAQDARTGNLRSPA